MINLIYTLASGGTDISTILITVVGTVGAGGTVKLVQMILNYRKEIRKDEAAKESRPWIEYKESVQERIATLESLVVKLRKHIETLITTHSERVIDLSTENATLIAELKAALEEIEELREELGRLNQ